MYTEDWYVYFEGCHDTLVVEVNGVWGHYVASGGTLDVAVDYVVVVPTRVVYTEDGGISDVGFVVHKVSCVESIVVGVTGIGCYQVTVDDEVVIVHT